MSWQRIDGTLVGGEDLNLREELTSYFDTHEVPALLEVYPEVDGVLGVSLLVDAYQRVAQIVANTLVSSIEVEELAADIAERFGVNVSIGDVFVEVFDESVQLEVGEAVPLAEELEDEVLDKGDEQPTEGDTLSDGAGEPSASAEEQHAPDEAEHVHGEDCVHDDVALPEPVRAVTITAADDDYFPRLARAHGEPVTTASLSDHTVIITSPGELTPGTYGWDDEALPVVQIIADGEDRVVVAQLSEPESATRTWGTDRIQVGVPDGSDVPAALLALLDSTDDDARIIASVSPTADVEAVRDALKAPLVNGPRRLLEALGVGADLLAFLDGDVTAEELPSARHWEPLTTADVIRTTVDKALDEAAETRVVELVSELDEKQPALTRSVSIVKAAAGSALFVAALRSNRNWRTAGLVAGGLLVGNSAFDIALYEWLRRRREQLTGWPRY